MKLKIYMALVSISILMFIFLEAKSSRNFPQGWPWRGVDMPAYVVESEPEVIDFIINNSIKYVRIHIFLKRSMKRYHLNSKEALEKNLEWAKVAIKKFNKKGIKSFITVADFPISLNRCADKRRLDYWMDKACINQIYKVVKTTVERMKSTNILGYEFLGEPVVIIKRKAMQPPNWNGIFENIIKITRRIDKSRWLFYSPGPWGLPYEYSRVVPFKDNRVIYNAHIYIPHKYTHQGIHKNRTLYEYPGFINGEYWNKERLLKSLQPLIEFQKRWNRPISISEFSTLLWAKGGEKYLKDLIDIFNTYNWSWFYFNIGGFYRGWDVRYEGVIDKRLKKRYLKLDNSSKRFLLLKRYLEER